MSTLKLVSPKHPALALTSAEVEPREDVSALVGDMWAVMEAGNGRGLAANQIGVLKRVIVVHADSFKQVFVNPVIVRKAGYGKSEEGCLTYPGVKVRVPRAKRITVEGFDELWRPVQFKLQGLAAICVQHEIDHLNGITIVRTKA